MSDRAEPVLAAALERLVENGTLTREQADVVRTDFHSELRTDSLGKSERSTEQRTNWTALLSEVGGYIGAAFVFGAAIALVGTGWDNFSEAARIALLGVPAVLLLIAAFAVAVRLPGGWSFRPPFSGHPSVNDHNSGAGALDASASAPARRLIAALVLVGGGLLAGVVAVITQDSGSDAWIPVVPLLVWAIGYLLFRGAALQVATAVALTWTVFGVIDDQSLSSGLVLVLAGAGWALLARYRVIEEQVLAVAVAGVMAFIGGEEVVVSDYEGLGYLLLGLLAVVGLIGYVRTQTLSTLGVGAVTLAVVVPQVVIDYTEGSLGAAGGLLVSGLSVVAVSVLAARLHRNGSGPTQVV